MPKFAVTAVFTASKYLGEFEADTEEQAIEMALCSDKNYASLCHQCTDEVELDDRCAHQAVAYNVDDFGADKHE